MPSTKKSRSLFSFIRAAAKFVPGAKGGRRAATRGQCDAEKEPGLVPLLRPEVWQRPGPDRVFVVIRCLRG